MDLTLKYFGQTHCPAKSNINRPPVSPSNKVNSAVKWPLVNQNDESKK